MTGTGNKAVIGAETQTGTGTEAITDRRGAGKERPGTYEVVAEVEVGRKARERE